MKPRVAVAVIFAVHGAVSGTFAVRIPWLVEHLHLSPGQLGIALLCGALGGLFALPFSGWLVHMWGSKTATRWLIPGFALTIAPLAWSPNLAVLCLGMLAFGAMANTSDVAMNAQGVAIEAGMGRSIMSGLHGMWSVGGLVSSAVGAIAARQELDARVHYAVASVVLIVVALVASRALLPSPPQADTGADRPPRFALPHGLVLVIGLVTFCAIFGEAATADWCAVYLRKILGASHGTAALSYTAFAFAMAGGRLTGDFLVRRFGPVRVVRIAAVLGTAGGVLVVIAVNAAVTMVGFALIGIGVAAVVPLAFAAAGHADRHPGHAIAGVATVAYGAGFASPSIIGGVATLTSLPVSFALVTVLIALIAVGAGVLRPAEAGRSVELAAEIRR
jgi:MFS family permease